MKMRKSDRSSSPSTVKATLLFAACGTLTTSALAANSAWSTTPADNTFTGTNWTTGVTVPGAPTGTIADGDSLFFGTSSVTTLNNDEPANFNLAGLTFNGGASAFTIGGANVANLGGTVTNNSSVLQTISQRLNLTATRALTSNSTGGNLLITGIISGSFTPQFRGTGTNTLTAANTFFGGTSEILDGSTLALDFSANGTQNNIISSGQALGVGTTAALTAQSNTLSITGSSTQSNAQTFGVTSIRNMAHLNFTAGAGQTLTVNFGALTGNNGNGGASDFSIGSGVTVNVASVVNAPSSSGVLLGGGNYAMGTLNQTTWAATNATTTTAGTISAFSGYVTTPGTTGDLDVVADAQTITADQRTIRFNTAGVSTLNLSGNRTVTNGGVLMTANAVQNVTISDGGTTTNGIRGISNRGLYVYQYNTARSLTIDATVTANGTGALVKLGNGILVLNKANTYTGNTLVEEGSLYVNGGVAGTSSGTGTGNAVTTARGTTLGGTGVVSPTGAPSGTNNIGIGGLLSPGPATGGIGTMTFSVVGSTQTTTAPVGFTSVAGLAFDLGTAGGTVAAPGTSDRLNVLGTTSNTTAADVAFNNNTINFLATGTTDGWYKLLDSDANTTLSGLTVNATTRQITAGLLVSNLATGLSGSLYLGDGTTPLGTNGTAGDLNDVYLQVTSVPEPAALTLLGLGVAGVLRRRTRRA